MKKSRKQPHPGAKPIVSPETKASAAAVTAAQTFATTCREIAAFWVAQGANGARSGPLPASMLRTLIKTATAFFINVEGAMLAVTSRLLWANSETRMALLQLQALSLRVLAEEDSLSSTDCELYCNVFHNIVRTLNVLAKEDDSSLTLTVVDLALRMDVLPAAAAALAALRGDGRLLATLRLLCTTCAFIGMLVCVASPSPARKASPSEPQPRPPGPDVIAVIDLLARSGLMEQATCALVRAGVGCSDDLAADGDHDHDSRTSPVQASGSSSEPSFISESAELYDGVMKHAHLLHQVFANAVKVVPKRLTSRYDVLVSSTAAVAAGPCFQYSAAAFMVAQLAAADGGTQYGLSAAQSLPPSFDPSGDNTSGPANVAAAAAVAAAGGRGAQQRLMPQPQVPLQLGSMPWSLMVWRWCFEQSPPVPVRPLSRGSIWQLALRAARVATASCRFHLGLQGLAREPPAAAQPPPQQQGGNDGPALLVPLSKNGCTQLLIEALRCAAVACPLRLQRRPPSQGAVAGGGPGLAAAAGAARRKALEWWSVAVPGMHAVLSSAEAMGAMPLEEIRPVINPNVLPDLDLDPGLSWLKGSNSEGSGDLDPAAPSPVAPPVLEALLTAGFIPLLERAVRAQQRYSDLPLTACDLWDRLHVLKWPTLGFLLAYGEPRQVGSLLATLGKLAAKCVEPLASKPTPAAGGAGAGGAAATEGAGCSSGTGYVMGEMFIVVHLLAERLGLRSWVVCAERAAVRLRAGDAGRPENAPGADDGLAHAHAPDPDQVGAEAAHQREYPDQPHQQHHLRRQQQQQQQAPLRQIMRCTLLAARLILPHLATIVKASWPASSPGPGWQLVEFHLTAAVTLLRWLPALLAAHAMARGRLALPPPQQHPQQQPAGPGAAAGLRELLLEQLTAIDVLDRVLRYYMEELPNFAECAAVLPLTDPMAELALCAKTLAALVLEFPDQVAAAMRQGRLLPAADLRTVLGLPSDGLTKGAEPLGGPWAPWLAARLSELEGGAAQGAPAPAARPAVRPEMGLSAPGLSGAGADVGQREAAEAGAAAEAEADTVDVPEQVARWALGVAAYELGAQLLTEMWELQRESEEEGGSGSSSGGGRGVQLPQRCSNPRCSSFVGDSEAGRPLLRCNGCGGPQYCCRGCQVAHWKERHRAECSRGKPGPTGGGVAAAPAAAASGSSPSAS